MPNMWVSIARLDGSDERNNHQDEFRVKKPGDLKIYQYISPFHLVKGDNA